MVTVKYVFRGTEDVTKNCLSIYGVIGISFTHALTLRGRDESPCAVIHAVHGHLVPARVVHAVASCLMGIRLPKLEENTTIFL